MHSPKETYSMTNEELDRALRQLRLGGMADVLAIRAQQARADNLGPLDFLGMLVHDELERRRDRLVSRRVKNAGFRDVKTLDTFDWSFNAGFDRAHIFDLATSRFIERNDDVLMLGNAGVGKSHIAQAIGMAAIHAGFHVLYREAHVLFEELVLADAIGERASAIANATGVQLLIVDDLGMRKLPANAAEDLLEIVMRRYERASTIITSNRPLEDWPRMFGDTPAVTAFLDRLMHHSHLIELRGKSYRLHQSSVTARQRKATDSK
jgi:DNA replication protein DnaC